MTANKTILRALAGGGELGCARCAGGVRDRHGAAIAPVPVSKLALYRRDRIALACVPPVFLGDFCVDR